MSTHSSPFRVAIVPGVNPGKWTKAWAQRRTAPIEVTPVDAGDQRTVLVDGLADVSFVRLPVERHGLSVIRLYEEATVVVVPGDHPIALFDSVTTADLDGETIRHELLEDAIDLVVAGVGVLVVPQSIARQHARRDLAMRPITDAAATEIAIAWLSEATTPDIEEFVGIVRGRTAASSRGAAAAPAEPAEKKPAPKKQAPKKPGAKKPAARKPTSRQRRPR